MILHVYHIILICHQLFLVPLMSLKIVFKALRKVIHMYYHNQYCNCLIDINIASCRIQVTFSPNLLSNTLLYSPDNKTKYVSWANWWPHQFTKHDYLLHEQGIWQDQKGLKIIWLDLIYSAKQRKWDSQIYHLTSSLQVAPLRQGWLFVTHSSMVAILVEQRGPVQVGSHVQL